MSLREEMRMLRPQHFSLFDGGVREADLPTGTMAVRFNLGELLNSADPAIRHTPDGQPTFVAEYRWDQRSPFIFEFQGKNTIRFVRDPEEARMPGHGFIVGSLDLDRDQWNLSFAGDRYYASAGGIHVEDGVSFPNHGANTVQVIRMHYGPRKPVLARVFDDLRAGETAGHNLVVDDPPNLRQEVFGHLQPLHGGQPSIHDPSGWGRVPQNDYGQSPEFHHPARQGFY